MGQSPLRARQTTGVRIDRTIAIFSVCAKPRRALGFLRTSTPRAVLGA